MWWAYILLGGAAYYALSGDAAPKISKKKRKIDKSCWSEKDKKDYSKNVHKMCDNDPEGFEICSQDYASGISQRSKCK